MLYPERISSVSCFTHSALAVFHALPTAHYHAKGLSEKHTKKKTLMGYSTDDALGLRRLEQCLRK